MKTQKNYIDISIKLLWIVTALVAVKSIVTDTGYDNAYTVAMAYRHLNGDAMLTKMWEPNQTSMYVAEFLMLIYRIFVPSLTGVVIFIQFGATILSGLLCIPLYKVIKEVSDKNTAQLACIFFLLYKVKQSPFPDYANLLVSFTTLMFICLVRFFKDESKIYHLILAGVMLCLAILAYPSGIICFIPAVIIIVVRSRNKLKNSLLFTATCAVIGGCYTSYFLIRIGIKDFIFIAKNIVHTDSHEYIRMYSSYFQGLAPIILWVAGSLILGIITAFILNKLASCSVSFLTCWGIYLVIAGTLTLILSRHVFEFTCSVYIIPLLLTAFGLFTYKSMEEAQKTFWLTGVVISVSACIAASMLTDLSLITVLSFLVLGGTISVIPVMAHKKEAVSFVICVLISVAIHRGLVIWGYGHKWDVWMTYEVENVVRRGPSAGLVTDYMTYFMTEENVRDHNTYINEDDTVLLVDEWIFDPIEFLLIPGEIATPSTIDTPIFNEHTLDYYAFNPEKMPTVVAVSCWYGQLKIDPDSFAMNWINEHYYPVADGSYWRYYRLK